MDRWHGDIRSIDSQPQLQGAPLDVWTSHQDTEEILNRVLLDQDDSDEGSHIAREPWWERPQRQSDLGILVKTEEDLSDTDTASLTAPRATELLFYAAALPRPNIEGLPTPPRSSSPIQSQFDASSRSDVGQQLRLYALPISHNVDLKGGLRSSSVSSICPGEGGSPTLQQRGLDPAHRPSSPKRRKLSNVFDSATQQRRRLKGHGGERISKAMALASDSSISNSNPALPPSEMTAPSIEQRDESAHSYNPDRPSLSRATSIASLPSVEPPQPGSRQSSFAPNKRSSLYRVESVASGMRSPSLTADSENSIEQQNRTSLSRTVMAGMRIYGLQQRKSPAKPSDAPPDTRPEEEEYKLIYHQTFKAASFVFRSQFSLKQVPPDVVREVVDRLLSMFCTDPLSKSVEENTTHTFGSQDAEKRLNPFDESKTAGGAVKLATQAMPLSKKEKRCG
ncbi:MAG: hypothetical protein Q9191_005610 [Dirinaria sp. TL-2023a]